MSERWVPVPGCPGYEVSSQGNFRDQNGVRLKPHSSHWGYLRIRLGGKRFKAHRLVCRAFHGPAPSGMPFALHGPKGRTVNSADNLRWGNSKMNYADRAINGERQSLKPFQYGKGTHPPSKGKIDSREGSRDPPSKG